MDEIKRIGDLEPNTEATAFYGKFINGDFGLAKTFWLFGFLLNAMVVIAMRVLSVTGTLEYAVVAGLTAYKCALLVAILNAARRFRGSKIWSVLAVLVVVSAIARQFQALLAT